MIILYQFFNPLTSRSQSLVCSGFTTISEKDMWKSLTGNLFKLKSSFSKWQSPNKQFIRIGN